MLIDEIHETPDRPVTAASGQGRSTALVDDVLTRPIVSAGMIAAELKITPVRPKTSSPSSACARRPGGDAIGPGGFCEAAEIAPHHGSGSIRMSAARVMVSTEFTSRSCGRSPPASVRCAITMAISRCASSRATDGKMIRPG